jgi:Sulfotransferase family
MDPTAKPGAASSPRPPKHPRLDPAPVLFVGGTGRSGSHVTARLLSKHHAYMLVPIEVRFHVDADGFPGLLAGRVSKQEFASRMRGFWWRGFQTNRFRGLHRLVPRERFERALATFEERFASEPESACRELFLELLRGVKGSRPDAGIIEQSCDTVAQADTLVRLFPEARFVHAVRDGRDASASRVEQRGMLVYPRTRRQGLDWWERRLRRIERGAAAIPPGSLYQVELGELLERGPERRHNVANLARFAGVRRTKRMRRFLRKQVSAESANAGRWRRGLSARRQERLDARYREILAGLERDELSCAPLLRRAYDRDPHSR